MNYEIHHIFYKNLNIFSKTNCIYVYHDKDLQIIKLPLHFLDLISFFSRTMRRLFRTDKCNVFILDKKKFKLLIIRRSIVYTYTKKNGLTKVLQLRNCRNLMHIDLCRTPDGKIYFGEYGSNNKRLAVPIYCSNDNGNSWHIIYEYPKSTIKHIHNVKYDKYTNTIWCCTGDNNGENNITVFDLDFKQIFNLNDGKQTYRTCNLFFQKDHVYWLMDSPNDLSYVIKYDRSSKVVHKIKKLEGPVWYSIKLSDNSYVAATSVEPGYSMKHKKAFLYYSENLENWKKVRVYVKDFLPINLFKFGVIAFPNGVQNIDDVSFFGEALNKIDGKIKKINIRDHI